VCAAHGCWHKRRWPLFLVICPSRVGALPLAAGIKEGGHYFRYFFLFFIGVFLPPLFKTREGFVVWFQILVWAPKKK
jgi:hypothetical protein